MIKEAGWEWDGQMVWLSQVMCLLEAPSVLINIPTTNIQHCSQDQVWPFCEANLSLNILQDDIARARLLMLSSPLKLRIAGHHTQSHPACAACASQMMLGVILFLVLG